MTPDHILQRLELYPISMQLIINKKKVRLDLILTDYHEFRTFTQIQNMLDKL